MLKAVSGFTDIGALTLGDLNDEVVDLSAFEDMNTTSSIKIINNSELKSLRGLDNIVDVAPPRDSGLEQTGDNKILISGNPRLTSLAGLGNLETVGIIQIFDNHGLGTIDGINSLKVGHVGIENNSHLKAISGFKGWETGSSMTIIGNVRLTTIDGFQNMKEFVSVKVQRNYALDECEIHRILDQLDEPPQTLDISNNGKTCQ